MSLWWDSLTLLQRVLACIAVPATLVLIIQTLLSLLGLAGDHDLDSADHDFDHDFDHDSDHELSSDGHDHDHNAGYDHDHDHGAFGLSLLTFRGVIAFLAVYGWGSLAISRAGHPWLAAIGFGLLMGFAAMVLVAVVMKLFISLQSNGAVELENAIGLEGVVYLTVPPAGEGQGKVSVLLQERYMEFDAVSSETESLVTGEKIVVTGLTEDSRLIVGKIQEQMQY